METFPRYLPFVRELIGHRWIPRTKASDAELWCFLWSTPWTNGWVNNRGAGDLRRHRSHHDDIVMDDYQMCWRTAITLDNFQCGNLFLWLWERYTKVSILSYIFEMKQVLIFMCFCNHDDVIKWKHFPRYWPFVRGIHRSPVNSPHRGQRRGALMFSWMCALNKRLSKQSWGWWFQTPSCSLWRHCNGRLPNACLDQHRSLNTPWQTNKCWPHFEFRNLAAYGHTLLANIQIMSTTHEYSRIMFDISINLPNRYP